MKRPNAPKAVRRHKRVGVAKRNLLLAMSVFVFAFFDAHPRLKAGWDALQQLHGLYLADDCDGALEALDRFCDLYATGDIPEFHDIVDAIIAWSDEILAWHHTRRVSNGRIEGTDNLLQVLRRTAHGFTNPDNFAARGILIHEPTGHSNPQNPRLRALRISGWSEGVE